ncbi:serine hydrolase domain-containing protein [Bordetella muralis]|jgi:CubicO group peptidase (beta-lactamase class C family)|uniref:serine hydrolase domain-containing protein n=1 Tax=Bordetella muralis TaxID=1649130 RepID=UPI0039F07955
MQSTNVEDGRSDAVPGATELAFDDGLLRAAPSSVGIDGDQIIRFLDQLESAGLDVHSFMLHRQGKVAAEGWRWPYRSDRLRVLHSVAKSFTACAIGLAIGEGRLSLSDKVVNFFPDEVPTDPSEWLQAMTVRDLLTMRTGHAQGVSGAVWRNIASSWTAEFFKIPLVYAPGTRYVYTSAASYMLSAILTKITGQTLHAYLKPRLFEPLGIRDERWSVGPDGINPGGNGLTARTADLLKLGLLHAQGGRWNGSQILPERWVHDSTRAQGGPDSTYGYHWQIRPAGAYSAIGVFVQLVTVFPEHDVTLAITAAIDKSATLLPYVQQYLVPAFLAAPMPDAAADGRLAQRLRVWQAEPSAPSAGYSDQQGTVAGKSYVIDPNAAGVESIRLIFVDGECRFQLTDANGSHEIRAGLGQWIESVTSMPGQDLHHGYTFDREPVVAMARWAGAHTLEMTWIFPQTAFKDTVVCTFDGDRMTVQRSVNVNSGLLRHPDLTGMVKR